MRPGGAFGFQGDQTEGLRQADEETNASAAAPGNAGVPKRAACAFKSAQSKYGPGSVLRPGAMSLCPTIY